MILALVKTIVLKGMLTAEFAGVVDGQISPDEASGVPRRALHSNEIRWRLRYPSGDGTGRRCLASQTGIIIRQHACHVLGKPPLRISEM